MRRSARALVLVVAVAVGLVAAVVSANRRALLVRWHEHVLDTSTDTEARRPAIYTILRDGDDAALERLMARAARGDPDFADPLAGPWQKDPPRFLSALLRAAAGAERDPERGHLLAGLASHLSLRDEPPVHFRGHVFHAADGRGPYPDPAPPPVAALAWARWLAARDLVLPDVVEELRPLARTTELGPSLGAELEHAFQIAAVTSGGPTAREKALPGDVLLRGRRRPGEPVEPIRTREELDAELARARDGVAEFVYFARAPGTYPRGAIQLGPTEPLGAEARRRVFLWHAHPGLPAARAGLEPGDAILAVDGVAVAEPDDLDRLLRGKERVLLSIDRQGTGRDVPVELVPPDEDAPPFAREVGFK